MIHPWDMMGKEMMTKYWLPWLVGMPAETSRAACSMVFSGIFDKFPKLRVMFSHASGAFLATLGRIEHGWRCRPDLVAVDNPNNPSELPRQILGGQHHPRCATDAIRAGFARGATRWSWGRITPSRWAILNSAATSKPTWTSGSRPCRHFPWRGVGLARLGQGPLRLRCNAKQGVWALH